MKRHAIGLIALAALVGVFCIASAQEAAKPEYCGASKCKMCHSKPKMGGAEYLKWEKANHSQAYKALESDSAKEIAKQAGVDNPLESEKCLKCHVTNLATAAVPKEEGIGCERCHGPGSVYKKKSTMEDYKAAVEAGMKDFKAITDKEKTPEENLKNNTKALCLECHGIEHKAENPAAKEFDFDKSWEKVKHDEETLKKEFPEAFKE